jgi:glycosyltransferase involved in cell wall biosynthesis
VSAIEPRLTVVICSLNGGDGVRRCIGALHRQTIADAIQVVVVDDGSTDDTAAVAVANGAELVRHRINRGLSVARNSGIARARAKVVGFLDDDCEPQPDWAERLLSAYDDDVVAGAGGPIAVVSDAEGFMAGYLVRHNPLGVMELNLAHSGAFAYRFKLYVKRMWSAPPPDTARPVYSLVGANMSFRREILEAVGGFDERFTFGADELDICYRIGIQLPWARLRFEPTAIVGHHFHASLRDTVRRARAYGVGSARFSRRWRDPRPTLYPLPVIVAALLGLSPRWRPLAVAAVVLPHLFGPRGVVDAVAARSPRPLLDAYVQLLQEASHDVGCVTGLWRFRDFEGADAASLPVIGPGELESLTAPAAAGS